MMGNIAMTKSSDESEEEENENSNATEQFARVPGLTFYPEYKPGQMIRGLPDLQNCTSHC